MSKTAEAKSDLRSRLLRKCHVLARNAGLDTTERYALQRKLTGKDSLKEMTVVEMRICAASFESYASKGKGGKDGFVSAKPLQAKLKALWISGYHLGVLRSSSDEALMAWAMNHTGTSAARFTWNRAAGLVEALKAWLARPVESCGGGVDWSPYPGGFHSPGHRVVEAQFRILCTFDQAQGCGDPPSLNSYLRKRHRIVIKDHLDLPIERIHDIIRLLGADIRKCRK